MLNIDAIRTDGGTQSRVQLNQETLDEYAEAYRSGALFPPIIVFFDGVDRWLADGFHRYSGAKAAGHEQIYAEVTPGTRRDAVLYSLTANATHGLKRTNADKRKAIKTLLADTEWSSWSDNKIAKAAGVTDKTVGAVRKAISGNSEDEQSTRRTVERNGKAYQQNTSRIGKSASAQALNATQTSPDARVNVDMPAPKPATFEPSLEDDGGFDPLDELEATNKEITKLRTLLETDNKAAEVLRFQEAYEVAERRSDEHLRTIASRDSRIAFLACQLDRCGQAVGEQDQDKIAAAVTAMACTAKVAA